MKKWQQIIWLGLIVLFAWHGGKALLHYSELKPLPTPVVKPVSGQIVGLPQQLGHRLRFILQTAEGRLQLSWYGRWRYVVPGDQWRLLVKLKPLPQSSNPGSFQYGRYLLHQGIVARGYVKKSPLNQRLSVGPWHAWTQGINRLRYRWRQLMLQHMQTLSHRGIMLALALGDKSLMNQTTWQVFRRTGTSHLVAISGLHIGLVAMVVFWLLRWSLVGLPWLSRRFAAQQVAWIGAFLAALGYSAMAGFAIPTQRALIMIGVFVVAKISLRYVSSLRGLGIAALLVVLWDPLSVFSPGTWLSFGAVAALFYVFSGRVGQDNRWQRLWLPQWVVFIGLLPLMVFWFGQFSLISLAANVIAIPYVSMLVVPCVLVSCLLLPLNPMWGHWGLMVANHLLSWIWWYLQHCAALPWASVQLAMPPVPALLLAGLGILLILAPRAIPGRWFGIFMLLPLFFWPVYRPPRGAVLLTVLDVGQGLAAVVQTRQHTLIYDTGLVLGQTSSTERVIMPFLRYMGVHHLDRIVVSHGDIDHRGGLMDLHQHYPQAPINSSSRYVLKTFTALNCHRQGPWQWDGVHFEYLNAAQHFRSRNNRSCVLRVAIGRQVILLPGDIEKKAEDALLKQQKSALKAVIVIAPHHGSKSSSSAAFVKAVSPRWVIFAAGRYNRFGFPHQSVIQRYQKLGATLLNTATVGAIQLFISPNEVRPYQS